MGTQINLYRISKLLKMNSKKRFAGIIFFDFKSAFDIVSHDLLKKKLKYFTKDKNLIEIAEFCLDNSFIKLNGKIHKLNRGVPQGSLISPTLFCMFIDDLLKKWKEAKIPEDNILAYADDIAIVFKDIPELDSIINLMNEWT